MRPRNNVYFDIRRCFFPFSFGPILELCCIVYPLNQDKKQKYLTVSLAPRKCLLWQYHHFCLFQLMSSVNLLWCQIYIYFTILSGRRGALFLLRGQMSTSGCKFIKKLALLCQVNTSKSKAERLLLRHWSSQCIILIMLLLNQEKHKQGVRLCYDVYNQTKQHFAVPISFGYNESSCAIFS